MVISTYHIPTWTTPLIMVLVVTALVPGTSLLGHLCGVGFGYLGMVIGLDLMTGTNCFCSWLWICQVPGSPRVGIALGRIAAQLTGETASLRKHRPEDIWTIWSTAIEQPTQQQCGNRAYWDHSAARTLRFLTGIKHCILYYRTAFTGHWIRPSMGDHGNGSRSQPSHVFCWWEEASFGLFGC